MTFREIIQKFKDADIEVSAFAYEDVDVPDDFQLSEPLNTQRREYNHYWGQSRSYRDNNPSVPKYDAKAALEEYLNSFSIPKWTEIDQYGGEGKGDTWWSVKYFPEHDVYVKVSGWYQSYNGTDFGDWDDAVEEVRPQQKTITVYE